VKNNDNIFNICIFCLQFLFSDVFCTDLKTNNYSVGLSPRGLRHQAQVKLESLASRHMSAECAKLCARRSVSFCSQSGGGSSIGLLT